MPQEPSIEDLRNNLTPLTEAEVEPMLLLDTSGSMSWAASDGGKVSRIDLVGEALKPIVAAIEDEDSQADAERAAGADKAELGGVMTVGFSAFATDYEDINSENFDEKWAEIKANVGGGTQICGGWERLEKIYDEEFGKRPIRSRPKMLALIITDGEAQDGREFAEVLAEAAKDGGVFVVVAVVGHGKDHDATLVQYRAIEANHPENVRVLTFDSVTDPATISTSLRKMIGK